MRHGAAQQTAGAKPKNIIFFLGDGMGINTLTAARIYAVGEEGQLTLDTLPESAFVKTYLERRPGDRQRGVDDRLHDRRESEQWRHLDAWWFGRGNAWELPSSAAWRQAW